jgi:hypothetical protein
MKELNEFAQVLGEPPRPADTTVLRSLGVVWGADFPDDFLKIMTAYGDSKISDFIWIYGRPSKATCSA